LSEFPLLEAPRNTYEYHIGVANSIEKLMLPILTREEFFFDEPGVHTIVDQAKIQLPRSQFVGRDMVEENFERALEPGHFTIHGREIINRMRSTSTHHRY
jgi:hypothetical protein